MPKPTAKTGALALELLSHSMMGMALGVFVAGLLLFTQQVDLDSFIKVPVPWIARLIFLLSIGITFGISTTLTGAVLLFAKTLKS